MTLVLALGGCGASPLGEVEIEGGSPAQRERVRAAVTAFDSATGGVVDLRAITFTSTLGRQNGFDVAGRYENERIRLLDTLVGDELDRVVGHELCHALDDDLALSDGREVELDALRDAVLDEVVDARSAVHERREVVARLCERGGPVASLLSVPSDDLPEAARSVFQDLREVFVGTALADASPERGERVASAVHHPASSFRASLRGDRVLNLAFDDDEAWVDLWTGEAVPPSYEPNRAFGTTETPWGEELVVRVEYFDDVAIGGYVTVEGVGHARVVRYVLPGDDGWEVLPDAVAALGHTQTWAADGWFWIATHTGDATTWAPVRP